MELSENKIGEIKGLLKAIRQIGSGNEDLEKMVDEIERILAPPFAQALMELCHSIQGFKPQKVFHVPCMPQYPRPKSLSDMIDTDPESVIFDIKGTWAYINFGVSLADSAVNLTVPELLKGIMSLRLHPGEWLSDWLLSKLLKVSHMEIIDAVKGKVSDLLKMRLAEAFGDAGGADKSAGSEPGKTPSDAKGTEGHADTPAAPAATPKEAPKKKGRPKTAERPAAPATATDREKLVKQVQIIIDEAHTDNVSRILDRVQDAGIRLGKIAELLGVDVKEVYAIRGGKNKPLERKFWKIFAKPNLSSRNRLTEEA